MKKMKKRWRYKKINYVCHKNSKPEWHKMKSIKKYYKRV